MIWVGWKQKIVSHVPNSFHLWIFLIFSQTFLSLTKWPNYLILSGLHSPLVPQVTQCSLQGGSTKKGVHWDHLKQLTLEVDDIGFLILLTPFHKPEFVMMGNPKTSWCIQNSFITESEEKEGKEIVFKKKKFKWWLLESRQAFYLS